MGHLPSEFRAPADLLELFIAQREGEGKSDRTIEGYRDSIEKRFLQRPFAPVDIRQLSADHVVLYLAYLRREGLAPASINHHQRALNGWLRWLYKRGETPLNIADQVDMVQIPKQRKRAVTTDDLTRILTLLINPQPSRRGGPRFEHQARNVAIIRLLAATGLRRGELLGLDYEHVDWKRGELSVQADTSKAREWRMVPFDAATKAALIEYRITERGTDPGPLFLTRDGQRMTQRALRALLDKISKLSGKEISTHDFRRGFAANARQRGLDVGHVKTILGHRGIAMTLAYSESGESEAAIAAYRERIG